MLKFNFVCDREKLLQIVGANLYILVLIYSDLISVRSAVPSWQNRAHVVEYIRKLVEFIWNIERIFHFILICGKLLFFAVNLYIVFVSRMKLEYAHETAKKD